jgi:hypothetical protein
MSISFPNDAYRSAKTLSYVTMGLFGGLALCGVLYIIFSFGMLLFPDALFDLDNGETLWIPLILMGLVGLLEVPLRIGVIVLFLIWLHRAFKNLPALKAQNTEFSPGWAVGWWFVPFANLVKPFQAMKELWRESDPEFDEDAGFLSSAVGAPAFFGFWWAFWIISNILGRIADRSANGSEMEVATLFPYLMIFASIFMTAAALLALYIVKNITERQEERFRKIGALNEHNPPPPPDFSRPEQIFTDENRPSLQSEPKLTF